MKWEREYHGFESIIDLMEDVYDEAIDKVVPHPEWTGTLKVTIEYIPDPETEAPA